MSLPSGYKRLEYIESSGTQYVDTGVVPTNNTKIEVRVKDSFYASINGTYRYGLYLVGPSNRIDIAFGSTGYKSSVISNVTFPAVVTMENGLVTANGDTATFDTQSAFTCSGTLPLFSDSGAGTLYYCKIYEGGTLIRDFIPCQTSSGEIGLWDDVNSVFYGNAGTGTFTAGPVVPEVPAEDPGFFTSLGVTMQAAVLVWGAVNPGQRFRLYRNEALIYEGTDTHYTDSGLISDVTYSYRMAGFNGSEESAGLSLDIRTRDTVWLITDRTDRDTGDKGHYNCLDLIRVNEALDYVAELLRGAGYIVSVNTRKDWSMNDIPTPAEMAVYIQNIQAIKNTMEYLSTTPQPPRTMNRLTWQQANDIEQLLVDAEYTIFHIHEGLKRTGQFDAWCGPGPRFATAKHSDGRTWEELDAMETEWSGWDAATWYSLLYGHVRGEVS